MLYAAAKRSCEVYVSHLERGYDPENQHEYPAAFERKIKKLQRRADHPVFYRSVQRAASLLLALLLAGGALLAVSPEARAAFVGWVKETYEMFFVYRYSGDSGASDESSVFRPKQLPDSYTEYMVIDENGCITVLYKNESGKRMKFGYIYNPNSSVWYVDTDGTVQSDTSVNGFPAELFTATHENVASIVMWTDSTKDFAFYVSGFFSEAELISIAESVSIVK